MTEFDKITLVDDRKGLNEPNKTILGITFLPDVGDRIKFGNGYPKVGYRHLDYDTKTVYLYMR